MGALQGQGLTSCPGAEGEHRDGRGTRVGSARGLSAPGLQTECGVVFSRQVLTGPAGGWSKGALTSGTGPGLLAPHSQGCGLTHGWDRPEFHTCVFEVILNWR